MPLDPEEWWDFAYCKGLDTNIFFTDTPKAQREAIAHCSICPVRTECLEYALTHRYHGNSIAGVWGGTTTKQRDRIRRRRTLGAFGA